MSLTSNQLSELQAYKTWHKQIEVTCYGDEVILLSDNEDNLQRHLHRFDQLVGIFNAKLSPDKQKLLL